VVETAASNDKPTHHQPIAQY